MCSYYVQSVLRDIWLLEAILLLMSLKNICEHLIKNSVYISMTVNSHILSITVCVISRKFHLLLSVRPEANGQGEVAYFSNEDHFALLSIGP